MSRLFRFADLIANKYKTAALDENQIRREVLDIWNMTNNKTYSILRKIAAAGIKGAANTERKRNAKRAHIFVKSLLSVIDDLKIRLNTVPISEIESTLKAVANEIEEHAQSGADPKGDAGFPDLTDYIFEAQINKENTENYNQSDKRWIESQYSSIRTVLTNIHSMADAIATKLGKYRGVHPVTKHRSNQRRRLNPRRSPLYKGDIVDFIRQHGPQYGLYSTDDWTLAFQNDQQFKEDITTVINAINRGHDPKDEASVKADIAEVMKNHEMRKATNEGALEAPELPKPAYISPELKEERMQAQREQAMAKAEEWAKLQELIRQRDEANERHRLENQPPEEEMQNKFSSLRMQRILKRYQ